MAAKVGIDAIESHPSDKKTTPEYGPPCGPVSAMALRRQSVQIKYDRLFVGRSRHSQIAVTKRNEEAEIDRLRSGVLSLGDLVEVRKQ